MAPDTQRRGPPELAQKGCLLEGLTEMLSRTPGDYVVLLHSDPDCANIVSRDAFAIDPGRFYCTNLGERDLITGSSRARLREAIAAILAVKRPRALLVIGSCVTSMIADDIAATVAEAAADAPAGTRLIALPADAFRMVGQAEILDLYTGFIAEYAEIPAPEDPRSVNIFGFPGDGGEAKTLLGRIGITAHVAPFLEPPAVVWNALPPGALNVVPDARLFRRLLRRMEELRGTPFIEAAPASGLAATERFHAAVAARFGLEKKMQGAIAKERDAARKALAAFQRRLKGVRLAYHIGAGKSFNLETAVREGLLYAELFPEMGFAVELLFQGPVAEAHKAKIAALLEFYGVRLPFVPLPDRPSVTAAIRERRYDLLYGSDSLRDEVAAAGIPLLPFGSMRPGFGGLVSNIRTLDMILGAR